MSSVEFADLCAIPEKGLGGTTSEDDCIFNKHLSFGNKTEKNESGIDSDEAENSISERNKETKQQESQETKNEASNIGKIRYVKAEPGRLKYSDVSEEELATYDMAGKKIVQFKKSQYELSAYVKAVNHKFETSKITYYDNIDELSKEWN